MQGSHSDGGWESDAATLIDFSEGTTAEEPPRKGDDLLTGNWSSPSSETSQKALQSYTQLLLAGRKKVSVLLFSKVKVLFLQTTVVAGRGEATFNYFVYAKEG